MGDEYSEVRRILDISLDHLLNLIMPAQRDYDPEFYQRYLKSGKWARKRKLALRKAKHRCQLCNKPSDLQVHHRSYANLGSEPTSDLTVLCGTCHNNFHTNVGLWAKGRRRRKIEPKS